MARKRTAALECAGQPPESHRRRLSCIWSSMEVEISGMLVLSGLVNFSTVHGQPAPSASSARNNVPGRCRGTCHASAVKDRTEFKLLLSRTFWVGAVAADDL